MPTMNEQAKALIGKYKSKGDRYAQHRAAEVECWNAWYRSSSSAEGRDAHFGALAHRVADIYHSGE